MSIKLSKQMTDSDVEDIKAANVKNVGPIQVSNVVKDEFGLDIPTELVPLPSKGRIYPSDSPLYGQEALEIRPMTAREEDILTSRAYIKKGNVISKLIESCLVDKSIDPDELISGDRNALMVALRITGYGAEYKAEIDCPACGTKSEQSFNLSELKIKRLAVDPVAEGSNLFELELPVSKKSVRVKFLTGSDEQEMMTIADRKKKSGIVSSSAVTDRLSRSIVSVAGISDKTKISMFVRNMPARDSLALRKFLDNQEPGIDMSVYMSCPSCNEESEVTMPLGASFFWPDA